MKLNRFQPLVIALGLVCSIAVLAEDGPSPKAVKPPFDHATSGKRGITDTQILYHGGPVMNQSNSVYVIYYGSFASTTQPIINNFLTALSGSPQFGVNSTYNDQASPPVPVPGTYSFTPPSPAPTTNLSGSVYFDNYSQGTSLSDGTVRTIVTHAISGGLPANQNGIYLVITSPDVKVSGFCNSFCAYHSTSTAISQGLHIRYALIPDPSQRCSACNGGIAVYGDTVTPNLDMGADTMTDDIIHELSETVTDPDINAWYTKSGAENGDLCNYVYATNSYPSVYTVSRTVNGKTYTVHANAQLGNQDYLVQFIWQNTGAGFCSPKSK
jgi:hypothetical protein